jgi:hypothetical protein
MGDPTSATLAEACIQNIKHEKMYPMVIKHQIIGYFRYVEDMFLIYD